MSWERVEDPQGELNGVVSSIIVGTRLIFSNKPREERVKMDDFERQYNLRE